MKIKLEILKSHENMCFFPYIGSSLLYLLILGWVQSKASWSLHISLLLAIPTTLSCQ